MQYNRKEMEFIKCHRHRLETFSYKYKAFFSGSSSEIPAAYFLTKPTDLDLIMHSADVCAVPLDAKPPPDFKGEVLTIDQQGLSAGYVRIKDLNSDNRSSGSKQDYQKRLETFNFDNANGPAITSDVGWSALTFDRVFAIRCPYWPPEAQEWRTRHRPYGWPSKDLIDEIVREGCFLVGKSQPICQDNDETQWRYSFSKAEMRLISSWTDSQQYVYHVLRLIKSEVVKKCDDEKKTGLCTYHFKTQMLWACEEKPAEFWEDNNLITCICELLTEMEQRFTSRNFPNYFLRDCNLIEGIFIQDDIRGAVRMLSTELGRSFLKSQLPPKLCNECRFSISIPQEIAIYGYLFAERFGIPFQAQRQKLYKIQELVVKELDVVMNGIYNMQLGLGKTLGNNSYFTVAEKYFLKGIECSETVCTCSHVEVKRITLNNRMSLNTITALYESLENAELSPLVKGRNKWDLSAATSCTKSRCPYAAMSRNFPWNDAHGKFQEKWMNPSHLLSAAYLSNLYLTTERFHLCNQLVDKERRFALNASYSELFPMIFCPELASLFDKNIQAVLGLIWLCKYLLNGERRFEFSTCPLLFLHYSRVQSSLRIRDMNFVNITTCINNFNVHRELCNFRLFLHSSHYVLFEMAWRIDIRP